MGDYLAEPILVPGPCWFYPIFGRYLILIHSRNSLLCNAVFHAHPIQVYREIFLRLEALGAVNKVASRNPVGS